MNIALVNAAFPPDFDGIGDYTWWLAKALGEFGIESEVQVFTRYGNSIAPSENIRVIPFFKPENSSTFKNLPRVLLENRSHNTKHIPWIVFQYNPFSYGKWGFCPWVPLTLEIIKRRQSARIAVMFHETFTRETGWKHFLMRQCQQYITRRVANTADVGLFSCEAYMKCVRSSVTRNDVHAPVGSNLPKSQLDRCDARRIFNIPSDTSILGTFGSAHQSHGFEVMARTVEACLSQRRKVAFVYIGARPDLVKQHFHGLPFHGYGPVNANEAADLLRGIDIMLCPYSDGFSTRRTTAIAGIQQGTPVVSTDGLMTDSVLRLSAGKGYALTPVGDLKGFVDMVTDLLADTNYRGEMILSSTSFFDRMFSWKAVADRIRYALVENTTAISKRQM